MAPLGPLTHGSVKRNRKAGGKNVQEQSVNVNYTGKLFQLTATKPKSLHPVFRDIKFVGARHSHVEVTVGHLRGSGIAKNKKAAKQEAAKVLLQKLEGDPRFKSAGFTRTGVNKQKMAHQMKARFSREVAPNMTLQSE